MSFTFTPSPSALFGNVLNAGISTPPTATRSVMSTTSSNRRRPFGKPPRSPCDATEPARRLERRRRHARVQAHEVGDRARRRRRRRDRRPVLTSGNRSVRATSGNVERAGTARRRAPRSPARSSCRGRSSANCESFFGCSTAERVLRSRADHELVDERIAEALDLAPARRSP